MSVVAVVRGEKHSKLAPDDLSFTQVCLILDNGNYFELYSRDLQGCSSLDPGGLDAALAYVRKTPYMDIRVLK